MSPLPPEVYMFDAGRHLPKEVSVIPRPEQQAVRPTRQDLGRSSIRRRDHQFATGHRLWNHLTERLRHSRGVEDDVVLIDYVSHAVCVAQVSHIHRYLMSQLLY